MNQTLFQQAVRRFRQQVSTSTFIIIGIALSIGSVAVIYIMQEQRINPQQTILYPERTIVTDFSHRYTIHEEGSSNWTTGVNYKHTKDAIESQPEVQYHTIFNYRSVQRWVNEERISSRLYFADAGLADVINLQFVKGSYFSNDNVINEQRVSVISEELATKVFGTTDALNKTIELDGNDFRVVGVFKDIPKSYINVDEIIPITHDVNKDRETAIDANSYGYTSMVVLKEGIDPDPVMERMQAKIRTFEIFPEDLKNIEYYPYIYRDRFSKALRTVTGGTLNRGDYQFYMTGLVLSIILVTICFINVANLNQTMALNRQIEYGVKFAYGAKWTEMLKELIAESLLYAVPAALLGIAFAHLVMAVANGLGLYARLTFTIQPEHYMMIILYSVGVPLLSKLLTLYRMVRRKPIYLLKGVA